MPPKSAEAVSEAEVDAPMSEVAGVVAAGVKPKPTSKTYGGNMSTEDPCLALKIKTVETRNAEVQAMHRRIRALELDKGTPVASTVCQPKHCLSFCWVQYK